MIEKTLNAGLALLRRWGTPVGCLLLASVFLVEGCSKLADRAVAMKYMTDSDLPAFLLVVYIVIAIELGGGVALLAGYRRAPAARVLLCYAVLVTVTIHPFWYAGQQDQAGQFVQFSKNLAIIAGLLVVAMTRDDRAPKPVVSWAARVLVTFIFFMNAFGVISQERSTHELIATGVSPEFATLFIRAGQVTQALGGLLLLVPKRLAAIAGALVLAGFLVPATVIAHNFWAAPPEGFVFQLTNFFKNCAAVGSLLIVAALDAKALLISTAPEYGSRDTALAARAQ